MAKVRGVAVLVGVAVALVLAWGCGSSTEQGEVQEAHEHGEHGHHEHGEHGEGHGEHGHAPGPVSDFHAVLSPLWHADHGAARTDGTCTAVEDLRAKAQAIQSGEAPEAARADEAGYRQAAEGLVAAVDALGAACAEPERPSFEARFEALHTAFHGVAERASGE